MVATRADVIVIGAGAAGLTAAAELSAAGLSVIVLEGRDRIGGRVDTVHDPRWPVPIERGAEFIHGLPRETWDAVREAGLAAYDVTDRHHVRSHGRLAEREDFWDEIERVFAGFGRVRGDASFADYLARYASRQPAARRALAKSYVEGFNAADARVIGVRALAAAQEASDRIEGNRLFRLIGGYGALMEWIWSRRDAARVKLRLSQTVSAVHWRRGAVRVETVTPESGAFEARAAVVTLPLGVLQRPADADGGVRFVPELRTKREALRGLRMGAVVKVLLRFAEPVWEAAGFDDLTFLHAPQEAFPTWWTMHPLRVPVLTGWVGGPAAERLAQDARQDVIDVALRSLVRPLGIPIRRLRDSLADARVCDWRHDPFTRGAYSYAAVGAHDAVTRLARPIAQALFFAGEATHSEMSGTVAGAIASGRRAAKQVRALPAFR